MGVGWDGVEDEVEVEVGWGYEGSEVGVAPGAGAATSSYVSVPLGIDLFPFPFARPPDTPISPKNLSTSGSSVFCTFASSALIVSIVLASVRGAGGSGRSFFCAWELEEVEEGSWRGVCSRRRRWEPGWIW